MSGGATSGWCPRRSRLERAPGRELSSRGCRSRGADPPAALADVELPERFDLVLLGLGHDGHGLPLPRARAGVADPGPLVEVPVPGIPPSHPRLSFSLVYLNAQPLVALLVEEEKRDVLFRVLAGDESLPAARLHAGETVVLADEAVAPESGRA